MEEGAAQPDENDGQMAEVSRKDLARDLFEVTRVAIEVVSIGVEVPNPGGGFGTFGKAAIEMAGLAEQFEGGRNWVPVDHGLRLFPTFWWADGHRDIPRGTESRWWVHPFGKPDGLPVGPTDSQGRNPKPLVGASRKEARETAKPLGTTGALGPR